MSKVSPLAPLKFPALADIAGVNLSALAAGERYQDRDDVLLGLMAKGTTSAGVFTQSFTPGAPVSWSKQVLKQANARALVVNAGNANVCTGEQGWHNTKTMAAAMATIGDVDAEQVYVCSTGVIGEQPNIDRILAALPRQLADETNGKQDWQAAASAIMTTDTYAKGASITTLIDGQEISISGIAKGSGMIEPNMATMLAYVFTDAAIDTPSLQALLHEATQHSFNSITVDTDTSTSDTCLLFATGQAENKCIDDAHSTQGRAFLDALLSVMQDLARQIIRDGEGASKFITVSVCGAQTDASAKIIAKSIANSPLVKTAMAGEDANWGRIVMAIGKAMQPINLQAMTVSMGGVLIAKGDAVLKSYHESQVQAHIEGDEINIDVDVALASASGAATVWTCDLGHGYIDINADYRS